MLVGVYGSLKKGFYNHCVMVDAGATFVEHREITGYRLYSLGAFPALLEGEGRVHLEVYEVENIEPLDILEGHPTFYKREMINGVWVYIYQDTVDEASYIRSGVWSE
jgi:gamma-glutamylcyclotransferase (GGCT)/AIG2-like uncharacterized protein YtfP